jgi:hypothetical protein
MNQKNDDENPDINGDKNDIDSDIDYDFISEKTKSLNKFPSKMLTSEDFYLDETNKNFSKSLKFNSHKCFAPKQKIKQSSKNPTPIIYEKQSDIININTKEKIVIEDALTEKEESLDNESSFSSDCENEKCIYNKSNKNNDSNYCLQFSNYIISKNLLDIPDKKNEDKNEGLYENKINIIEDIKDNKNQISEDKNHTSFPIKMTNTNIFTKGYIKAIRSSLFRAKMKSLKEKFREVEYTVKDKMKKKFRLDIEKNKSKKICHNIDYCKIIPINNNKKEDIIIDKKDEDIEDMSNFRKTISYNVSKFKRENNEKKGFTIYDVLLTNKKNKSEK